ncbi:MAG: C39 family peptidase [Brevefilum sp.]|nr:C39 family peptidase [Brevefilum sp.]
MPKTKLYKILMVLLIIISASAFLLAIYFLPPVHERLSWRVALLRGEIYYFFNPPDEVIFVPGQQAQMTANTGLTPTITEPPPTATLVPSVTPTDYVSPTPTSTATPTPTPTPIPNAVRLEGVVYEKQEFNNCGPTNLAMALSYWGWEGDQSLASSSLKPNPKDRNVMPYEMVDYVRLQTRYNAVLRWGGDIEMIKKFIAAGFPVLIERGLQEEIPQYGWMGHYTVVTAYDDEANTFITQDSYIKENYANAYEKIKLHWRAFNYVYIIIYPPDREATVMELLGPHADETYNLQYAAQKALEEMAVLSERQLFFATFNYGTSLVNLGDYYGAAQAYDQAFEVYAQIFPRPYRLFWYSTGPYFAYYYTGRYQDVIDLADLIIGLSAEPAIPETWVWRGRARHALGDVVGAIEDYREALVWHPNWWVAENELRNLGVIP